MIDPQNPLFRAHYKVVADFMPNAPDPASVHGLMIWGIIIIAATALWAVGGMGAGVWVWLNARRQRRLHSTLTGRANPRVRWPATLE